MLFLRPIYTNTTTQREGNNMKTITFKTGRFYDFEQEITAYSYDGQTIHFCDPSRSICKSFKHYDGWSPEQVKRFKLDQWDKDTVMNWYDGTDRTDEVFDEKEISKMQEFNRKEYLKATA
jgi:hypothetical protein